MLVIKRVSFLCSSNSKALVFTGGDGESLRFPGNGDIPGLARVTAVLLYIASSNIIRMILMILMLLLLPVLGFSGILKLGSRSFHAAAPTI